MHRLAADLRGLNLARYPAVLVHASFKGLGLSGGSPAAVVAALVEAAGDATTLLFPTFTYSPEHGPECPPVINLATTPCCTGAIPEASRHFPGSVRSLHPTHSVTAVSGPNPGWWASGHELGESPCDQHSPFSKVSAQGGLILLLGGVSNDSNTTLHHIEELAGVPYHLQPSKTQGAVYSPSEGLISVVNRLHQWGWERDFRRPDAQLLASGVMRAVRVGGGSALLIDALRLRDTLLPVLRQDPLYLLAESARGRFLADCS